MPQHEHFVVYEGGTMMVPVSLRDRIVQARYCKLRSAVGSNDGKDVTNIIRQKLGTAFTADNDTLGPDPYVGYPKKLILTLQNREQDIRNDSDRIKQQEIADLQGQHAAVLQQSERAKQQQITQLREQLRQSETAQQQQIEQHRQSEADKQRQIEQLRQSEAAKDQEIAQLRESVAELRESETTKQQQVEQLRQSEADKQRQIEQLRQSEAAKEQEVAALRRSDMDKERVLAELRNQVAAAQNRNQELRQELDGGKELIEEMRSKEEASGAQAKKEEELATREHRSFYDFELDPRPSFMELCNTGWPVWIHDRFRQPAAADPAAGRLIPASEMEAAGVRRPEPPPLGPARPGTCGEGHMDTQWKGIIATVLGDFNKGKTWFLSKLTGREFPSGDWVHTPGLCALSTVLQGKPLIVLDTAGLNSPVSAVTPYDLMQKKAEEGLLREVVFELSDALIYVVNDMTAKEQVEIFQISQDLAKLHLQDRSKRRKTLERIIVVHNMRNLSTTSQWDEKWAKLREIYVACDQQNEEVRVGDQVHSVPYLAAYKQDSDPADHSHVQGYLEYQWHFMLGKDGTEGGATNAFTIEKIKQIMQTAEPPRRSVDFEGALAKSIEQALPKYVDIPKGGTLKAHYPKADRLCCSVVGSSPARRIPSALAAAGDRADQAVAESSAPAAVRLSKRLMLGTYVLRVHDDDERAFPAYAVFESDREVCLCMELPGINPDDISIEFEDFVDGNAGVRVKVSAEKPRPVKDAEFTTALERCTVYGEISKDVCITAKLANPGDPERYSHDGVLHVEWKKPSEPTKVVKGVRRRVAQAEEVHSDTSYTIASPRALQARSHGGRSAPLAP